ncbi:MAG TPA: response regulator transcription factor [Ohtaekwangia sp.]|nr:response regulator transcription factor [Ohtaekwangia sp.]
MSESPKIRILLVDDHALIREGLKSILNIPDIEVVGVGSSGEEAITLAQELSPDIIMMDIVMPGITGIEATRWIKEQNSSIKIILLSMEIKKEFVSAGIQAGISGYLHKDVPKETLLEAVQQVSQGGKFFNEAITNLVFEDFYNRTKTTTAPVKVETVSELTKREDEVLALVAQGLTNREVSEKLFISVKTVETHKAHILEKLGLKNTAELVKYAIKNKLVPL